jgi:hypothetical protein
LSQQTVPSRKADARKVASPHIHALTNKCVSGGEINGGLNAERSPSLLAKLLSNEFFNVLPIQVPHRDMPEHEIWASLEKLSIPTIPFFVGTEGTHAAAASLVLIFLIGCGKPHRSTYWTAISRRFYARPNVPYRLSWRTEVLAIGTVASMRPLI